MNKTLILLSLFLIFGHTAALSQPTDIPSDPGQTWVHEHTGTAFPAELGGFDRSAIRDLITDQLDVVVSYRDPNQQGALTLYIYRAAIDDVPLWFETAKQSLMNGRIGELGAEIIADTVFTPAGQELAAGMVASYSLTGSGYRSTAIAMAPVNGWLLKVRYTSARHSAQSLADEIQKIVSAVETGSALKQAPAAVAVKPCTRKLKLKSKAKRFRSSLADALIGGAIASAVGQKGSDKDQLDEPVTWCRDPADYGQWTVFRANESKDSYILPLGDSGRVLSVYLNDLSSVLSGDDRKRYTPVHMKLGQHDIYADLNVLPVPQTLLAAINENTLISSSTTWPEEGSTITIDGGLATDE